MSSFNNKKICLSTVGLTLCLLSFIANAETISNFVKPEDTVIYHAVDATTQLPLTGAFKIRTVEKNRVSFIATDEELSGATLRREQTDKKVNLTRQLDNSHVLEFHGRVQAMTPIDPQHNRVTIRVNEMEDAIEESPKNYRKDVYAVDGDGQLKYSETKLDNLKY